MSLFDLERGGPGRPVALAEGVKPESADLALSPGGRYVALYTTRIVQVGDAPQEKWRYDSTVQVLEAAGGKVIAALERPGMQVCDIAFGSGGNLVVGGVTSASTGALRLGVVLVWSLPPGPAGGDVEPKLLADSLSNFEVVPFDEEIRVVAAGADNTYFAAATTSGTFFYSGLYLVNLSDGQVKVLTQDTSRTSFALSPDERYIALGSAEGIVHVFETERPEAEVARLSHLGGTEAIAFSDDGKYIAAGGGAPVLGHALRVWLLQPDALRCEAQMRLHPPPLSRGGGAAPPPLRCARAPPRGANFSASPSGRRGGRRRAPGRLRGWSRPSRRRSRG